MEDFLTNEDLEEQYKRKKKRLKRSYNIMVGSLAIAIAVQVVATIWTTSRRREMEARTKRLDTMIDHVRGLQTWYEDRVKQKPGPVSNPLGGPAAGKRK